MTSTNLHRHFWLALAASSLWLGLHAGQARAQVTYFDRPPSADELRRALLGQGAPTIAPTATAVVGGPAAVVGSPAEAADIPGRRTRGIQWTTQDAKVGAVTQPASLSATSSGIREISGAGGSAGQVAGGQSAQGGRTGGASDGGGSAALPINFRLGSSRVEPDSMPYVEAVADVLRSDSRLSLVIEGHTDITGDSGRNLVLSWDRALGVMRSLVEDYGIDASRLKPIGKGASDPLPGRSARDGSNRRVQLRVATSG